MLSVVCLEAGITQGYFACYSPANEQAGSKLAMPITCRNEMAGQSARSTLVHHLISQEMNCRILVFYHKVLTGCIITLSEFTSGIVY